MTYKKSKGTVRRVGLYCPECQEDIIVFDNFTKFEDSETTEWTAGYSTATRKFIKHTCSSCGKTLGTVFIETRPLKKTKEKTLLSRLNSGRQKKKK